MEAERREQGQAELLTGLVKQMHQAVLQLEAGEEAGLAGRMAGAHRPAGRRELETSCLLLCF